MTIGFGHVMCLNTEEEFISEELFSFMIYIYLFEII